MKGDEGFMYRTRHAEKTNLKFLSEAWKYQVVGDAETKTLKT